MPRFRFECQYAGSKFHGWQKQPDVPTVQAVLEEAFASLFGCSLKIYGAGRTDRGVNSLGLTVHFQLSPEQYKKFAPPPARWSKIINRRLPPEVRINEIRQVYEKFHARHSAVARLYGYRFVDKKNKFTSMGRETGWVCSRFSFSRARRAVRLLTGQIPTETFSGSGGSNYQAELWPVNLRLKRFKSGTWLLVSAASFRYLMVRSIARAVQSLAVGIWTVSDLKELLEEKRNSLAPAPPGGCYFIQAFYHAKSTETIFLQGYQKIKKYF